MFLILHPSKAFTKFREPLSFYIAVNFIPFISKLLKLLLSVVNVVMYYCFHISMQSQWLSLVCSRLSHKNQKFFLMVLNSIRPFLNIQHSLITAHTFLPLKVTFLFSFRFDTNSTFCTVEARYFDIKY